MWYAHLNQNNSLLTKAQFALINIITNRTFYSMLQYSMLVNILDLYCFSWYSGAVLWLQKQKKIYILLHSAFSIPKISALKQVLVFKSNVVYVLLKPAAGWGRQYNVSDTSNQDKSDKLVA